MQTSSLRRRIGAGSLVVGLTLVLMGVFSSPAQAGTDTEHKVTICHRTNSNTNPYVVITVDESAVDGKSNGDHYKRHQGPIWDETLKNQHIKWGDVIPPVAGHHDGLNWDEATSPAFIVNGCAAPDEDPTDGATDDPVDDGATDDPVDDGATDDPVDDGDALATDDGAEPTQVAGNVITPAAAQETLPATGAEDRSLLVLGIGFLVIGAVVLVTKRAVV